MRNRKNGGKGKKQDENRQLKRKGAAAVAGCPLSRNGVPVCGICRGPDRKVGSDSSVQMSSDPDAVYVNSYTGTARTENFNDNWKFYKGDASGAENPAFNDSTWEQVNLPHRL